MSPRLGEGSRSGLTGGDSLVLRSFERATSRFGGMRPATLGLLEAGKYLLVVPGASPSELSAANSDSEEEGGEVRRSESDGEGGADKGGFVFAVEEARVEDRVAREIAF